MITSENGVFTLNTDNTTYAFRVMESGHLEHLYYGRRVHASESVMMEKHAFAPGNTVTYSKDFASFSLEDVCLEMSGWGKGDIREPFVEVVHGDGSRTSDFLFEKAEISDEKPEFETLPGSFAKNGEVERLVIYLKDKNYNLAMELHYCVYADCDVITRSAKLVNEGSDSVRVERLMSMQLDLPDADYVLSTFNGAWTREMCRSRISLSAGKHVNESCTGTSSNRANPFIMLGRPDTGEDFGECMGFNLIYSGNHYEAVQTSSYGKLRVVSGINPSSFSYKLSSGSAFEAPEAVFTYSYDGYNTMSHHLHKFIREHIVRTRWAGKARPVLLNSWEAAYFNINENKLLKLAKAGKDVGIELFVMDDGWFGERNDDTSSLGDWTANAKKLPNGIKGIADKIKALGMSFGIWVEPEMVNVESALYRQHPDWTLEIPGKPHSEGRNQRVLDLGKTEVQDYIIRTMVNVFASADISYVKWDMNRIFSDCYSQGIAAENQGEVAHRYICGLYRCMNELTRRFPNILFEGCASGGNRFDLGILCYFPQIWASDDTDGLCRAQIQYNYSYGYPQECIASHVSGAPNHQTLRSVPLESRFAVASFGSLGYECNLCDLGKEELAAIKTQIELYKNWRDVFQKGSFYRTNSFEDNQANSSVLRDGKGNQLQWCVVSQDKRKAVGMMMQKLAVPNTQFGCFKAKGLDENYRYHFYNRKLKYNIKEFGELVNTASPIHIRQGSVLHEVAAKFIKMNGEDEDYTAYGDTLMYAGVKLKSAFGATGYNDEVRFYQDFGARMYFMEAENADSEH
jgi:alpha-galactosidase